MISLLELKTGEKARIKSFKDKTLSLRLIDMGCVPGELVKISKKAPLGCPFAIHVAGYELSLRKDEASGVMIEVLA
jgi:ferrous iron transport protein A